MTCDKALELLSAVLDGELSVEEKAQLDRHLAQCDGCRALFDDLTAIHGACAGLEVTPPPALKANILQNLPVQEKPEKVIWVHWKRWAAMAAAFVLVSLAAWNLPKTGFSDPQVAPEQTKLTQDALTDAANLTSAPTDVSGVANDQPDVDPPAVSEGISDLESSVDPSPAPTPSPDFFNGEPVNVNAYTSTATGGAAQKKMAVTGYGSATKETATEYAATYSSLGDSAIFDTDAAEDAGVSDEIIPMFYSVRMVSPSPTAAPNEQPAPANGSLDLSAYFDDEAHLEPHPEMGAEENVPAELFKAAVTAEADALYCGVLTIQGDMRLKDYAPQVQENGELWYELSNTAFYILINELTDSTVDFDLRTTGADISSSAQTGLVIMLP